MISLFIAVSIATVSAPTSTAVTAQPGLTVRTGESWIFRIEQGQPANARKVDAAYKPVDGELMISITPAMGTMMTITNSTERFYNYRAFIVRDETDKGNRTSVCTVMNRGRLAIENWPYPIAAIRISDFAEAKEDTMVCR